MSELYECSLLKRLIDSYVESELILDPEDYLYCETEDELRLMVELDLHDAMNTGNVYWEDSENSIRIPDEFIEEWKHLKKNEASSM